MAVDAAEMNGAPAGAPNLFTKRNLIIGAVVIGGAAGLIMLLASRSPSSPPSNEPAPFDQETLQMSNLATQLLEFRGEQSVANAGLLESIGNSQSSILSGIADSQSETEAAISAGTTSTNAQIGGLQGWLASILGGLSGQIEDVRLTVRQEGDTTRDITLPLLGVLSGQIEDTRVQMRGIDSTNDEMYRLMASGPFRAA